MKIDYLLRYQNTDTGSDKIWGIICLNPDKTFDPFESDRTFDYVTFWGKKGGRLQTKQWTGYSCDAYQLAKRKQHKKIGYLPVDRRRLTTEYSGLKEELERIVTWAVLTL